VARQSFTIEDFSGGLDLVSSLNAIQPGFTPGAKNFRVVETGGIEKVKGYSAFATVASAVDLGFYAKKDGTTRRVIVASATKWQAVESDGTVTDIHTGMTAASDVTFALHDDKLYGLDVANNMAVWPGSGSATAYAPGVNTGPNHGIILGIWDNRMWIAKATGGKTGMRVEWSEPADPTNGFANGTGLWPSDNYVELAGTGSTSDRIVGGSVGPDGLTVFTTGSTYLIYDSSTGANSVVDADNGCLARRSLALIGGTIYGVNAKGVFATDGHSPLETISRRVDPLFQAEDPDLTTACGARSFQSYLMSYDRGDTNLMLEISPPNEYRSGDDVLTLPGQRYSGSIMALEYPASAIVSGTLVDDEETFFVDRTDPTKLRKAFDGGTFAGTDIECYYETPFMDFGDDSVLKRLRRVRIVGRGDIYVSARVEYDDSDADERQLLFPNAGNGLWDTGVWDTMTWGGYFLAEGYANLSARGRRIQLRITEESDQTFPLRSALDLNPSGSLGGAGVYVVEPQYTISTRRR
jgi:hypothetical protein